MGMVRAGKEPAEDVMRRITAACQEAGLTVDKTQTSYQRREDGDFRLIMVSASPPGVTPQREGDLCFSAVSIEATIDVNGRWLERVSMKCNTNDAPLNEEGVLTDPWSAHHAIMHGRALPFVNCMTWEENPGVAISDLVSDLQETMKERKLVQEALARGEQGPWQFAKSHWAKGRIL